jgi:hypothetical protein
MNMRNLAVVSAVVAGLFGLAGLLFPAQFVALFGVELPEAGLVVTRLFGAHVFAIAVLDWFARNDLRGGGRPGAERGIVLVNVLSPALSIILVVGAILGGIANEFGWVNVAILAVLGIAWVYLGLLERPTEAAGLSSPPGP